MSTPSVTIYTDGSARGNPGPGGYGTILMSGHHSKELSQGYHHTTNNRMELMAVIAGLKALKKEGMDVTIYSDSQYVVKYRPADNLNKYESYLFGRKDKEIIEEAESEFTTDNIDIPF